MWGSWSERTIGESNRGCGLAAAGSGKEFLSPSQVQAGAVARAASCWSGSIETCFGSGVQQFDGSHSWCVPESQESVLQPRTAAERACREHETESEESVLQVDTTKAALAGRKIIRG